MTKVKDFQILFYSMYPSLCQQAKKYIANQAVCEDIVQECFIKYWKVCEQEMQINNPSSYLNTAVKNSCINYLRKEKINEDIENAKLQTLIAEDDADMVSIDEMEIIKQALALLPDKCRQIFELSKIQNKSYKEIAKTLEISIKTVENQMGKALKIMRQFVKDNPQYFSVIFTILYNLFFIQK